MTVTTAEDTHCHSQRKREEEREGEGAETLTSGLGSLSTQL
jgi:hypothetical protein